MIRTISDLARDFPNNSMADCDGYRLFIQQVIPPGATLPLPIAAPEAERGLMEVETDQDMQLASRLRMIECEPFPDPEQGKRIVRLFNDAAGQLPKDASVSCISKCHTLPQHTSWTSSMVRVVNLSER